MIKKLKNLMQGVRNKKETKAMSATTPTKARVTIDYPQAGEVVTAPSYSIRIAAIEAAKVEVFIDGGILAAWQPCRFSADYWWYDWSGYLPGKHRIKVQAHTEDGRIVTCQPRLLVASTPNGN